MSNTEILNILFDEMGWGDFNTKVFYTKNNGNDLSGWFVESDILGEDGFLGYDYIHALSYLINESWRLREFSQLARGLFEDDKLEMFLGTATIEDFVYLEYPEYDPQKEYAIPIPNRMEVFLFCVLVVVASTIVGMKLGNIFFKVV